MHIAPKMSRPKKDEKPNQASESESPPRQEGSNSAADRGRRRSPSSGERRAEPGGAPESSSTQGPPQGAPPFGWSFRDFLTPYILLALSFQKAHGYFIEQYLRSLGMANVELSTLYRTLRQLEKDGLVISSWEPGPDGPARRIYDLTDAGRWWLDAGASTLATYRSLIDRFFGSYSGGIARKRDGEDDEKGASR